MAADNLAANFSRELADYIIYIIDVSGGDKIPRKGGPGITQADLLVFDLILCAVELVSVYPTPLPFFFPHCVSTFRIKTGFLT